MESNGRVGESQKAEYLKIKAQHQRNDYANFIAFVEKGITQSECYTLGFQWRLPGIIKLKKYRPKDLL